MTNEEELNQQNSGEENAQNGAGDENTQNEKKSQALNEDDASQNILDNALEGLSEYELLERENEKLKQETGETKDKYIRLFAEFDNYKKRTARERLDLINTAGQDVIRDILPVLDDFERAFKTNIAENEADHNEGFVLIYQKFKRVLENQGVKSMEAKGEVFDTDLHEAISEIPAPTEDMKGKIVDVIEQGYYLNDKIIRYAKVVVGK